MMDSNDAAARPEGLRPDHTTPMQPPEGGPLELVPVADLVVEGIDVARRRNAGEEKPVPVPWKEYGALVGGAGAGGFWPGLHVLVAGTGAGKTTFSCQVAACAAGAAVPTAYVGLELDRAQVGLRLAAAVAGMKVRWSDAYTGRANDDDRGRFQAAGEKMKGWPLYADFGPPGGWPASRLVQVAEQLRGKARDKSSPTLIVVDFLQLVGNEPDARGRVELRERIGRAAYRARQVAREHGAAVLVISSMARDKYGQASGKELAALLCNTTSKGDRMEHGIIMNPDELVGLGKESGEIEYAADSVTVLGRLSDPEQEQGRTTWAACVPKVRFARPGWCGLGFDGTSFWELPMRLTPELSPKKAPRANGTTSGGTNPTGNARTPSGDG